MSSQTLKVLFTGGGSAGHATPNVALIESLLADGCETVYVGSENGIEREIIGALGVPYRAVATGKLRRYFDWQNFVDPLRICWGFLQALMICARERPDVVFSKGGFVAVPVVYAAWMWRIPVIAHESDVTPGLANRLCFPVARRVCVNFPVTADLLPSGKAIVTGTPIRRSLSQSTPDAGRQTLGLTDDRPVLLAFGGSLGAAAINRLVRGTLDRLLARFQVVHLVGTGNLDLSLATLAGYVQREFLTDEFGDVLAAADLVVARAGAHSIYELLVFGKPHILIPLPASSSRGDQLDNARTFSEQGYSAMLEESQLSDDRFVELVERVYRDREQIAEKIREFEPVDSVTVICGLIKSLGGKT